MWRGTGRLDRRGHARTGWESLLAVCEHSWARPRRPQGGRPPGSTGTDGSEGARSQRGRCPSQDHQDCHERIPGVAEGWDASLRITSSGPDGTSSRRRLLRCWAEGRNGNVSTPRTPHCHDVDSRQLVHRRLADQPVAGTGGDPSRRTLHSNSGLVITGRTASPDDGSDVRLP